MTLKSPLHAGYRMAQAMHTRMVRPSSVIKVTPNGHRQDHSFARVNGFIGPYPLRATRLWIGSFVDADGSVIFATAQAAKVLPGHPH